MSIIIKIRFYPKKENRIFEDVRLVVKNFKTNKVEHLKIIPKGEKYILNATKFENHWNYKYLYQVRQNNKLSSEMKWSNLFNYRYLYPERTSEDGLKYLLYKQPKSEYLAIVFQAMGSPPSYNYIKSLNKLNINRLYIKDDYGSENKTKSTYYLGQNNDFSIERATQALIQDIVTELKINSKKTIFIGSSKGGFAALYHGYKFGAGFILPAGPQVLLGNYLAKPNGKSQMEKEIFKSIFGEINKDNREIANNLIKNALIECERPYPKTNIHIGYWEPHFLQHVVPFMEMANENGIDNISLHVKDYKLHSGIIEYYREFLNENIRKILDSTYK